MAAEDVPEAKKLLKLTLSLGGDAPPHGVRRHQGLYKPEQLVGRLVICVANLAPRKMKFGLSEGMVLAAGGEGEIHLLLPDEGATGIGCIRMFGLWISDCGLSTPGCSPRRFALLKYRISKSLARIRACRDLRIVE